MVKYNSDEFVEKACKIHNCKYDYSKVEYVNSNTKVCIICPEHGEFWQKPNKHLLGQGCKDCYNKRRKTINLLSNEEFIQRCNKVHNGKYVYSKTHYNGMHSKVIITCPKHGDFEEKAYNHVNGHGCVLCAIEANANRCRCNTSDFVEKAKLVHGDKYDYSKVNYETERISVTIICPIHGEYNQTPLDHLQGCGCPKCKSSRMENEIRILLEKYHIKFEEQKKFEWLGKQSLDFYLPEYNIAIECQGIQHFECTKYFGGIDKFLYRSKCDENKLKLCFDKGIKLLFYANYEYAFPYKVITNKNEIIKQLI